MRRFPARALILVAVLSLLPWMPAAVPVAAEPAAQAAERCFPQTGFCVADKFLVQWDTRGGLPINGYPLTAARMETLEDGKSYLVQWFERVRMELHPENAPPNDVLLGQFGRIIHPADPPVGRKPGHAYFEATGHNVAPDLLAYWEFFGGLPQFGFPLSEEFEETLEDGKRYTVQYFERARFERHPENSPPNHILLGQFGRRILAQRGGTPPPPSPAPSPSPAGCGPLPPPLSVGPTYSDPQGRFTARYPAGWSQRVEGDGNVSVVAPSGAGVTLAVADAPGRQIDEYKDQIYAQVKEWGEASGFFQLLCLDKVTVGQYPAYRLRFLHNRTDTPDGSPAREEIDRIFFLANGRSHNANGFMEPGDPIIALIEATAASIVPGP